MGKLTVCESCRVELSKLGLSPNDDSCRCCSNNPKNKPMINVLNLKEFRKQIKRDNSMRKFGEQTKARIINLIESKMNGDNDFLLEGIIQNIKDLI